MSFLLSRTLSPKFYSAIRIHMGHFTWAEEEDEYEVFRTTFVDYTVDGSPNRHVQQWKNGVDNTSKYTFKVAV